MNKKVFINNLSNSKKDVIQIFLDFLNENKIEYCLIGGMAVNAYVDPVVSLDLDIVIIVSGIEKILELTKNEFKSEIFPHSINLGSENSDIRIQIQTDERYQVFLKKAETMDVMGYLMKVASLEDLLKGKVWAYSDDQRRKSKRQKDLADIFRIIESFPELTAVIPENIVNKITEN